MSNQCPKCGQEAMSAMHKLMTRPHVCQHCGAEVRMNLIYTALVSIVYFGLAVWLLLSGIDAGSMFQVLIATIVFVGICLFIPFEEKPAGSGQA